MQQSHSHTHAQEHEHHHHHQPQHMPGHSIESEQKAWNSFAAYYGETIEKGSLAAGITLSRMTRLESAKNIVETGCATGVLTLYWLNNLPPGCKYTSIDLSEEMIKYAQQRKEKLGQKFADIEQSFIKGDAQDLSFIPDETVDAYICCLAMHHVPDPVKALREALRVLKKGGRIGISISSAGQNTLNEFFKGTAAKLNIEQFNKTHNQALKNRDDLINAAQEAGVQVDFCWNQDIPLEFFEESEIVKMAQIHGQAFQALSQDLRDQFIENLKEGFRENKKKFEPFKFNGIFLVGKKAE